MAWFRAGTYEEHLLTGTLKLALLPFPAMTDQTHLPDADQPSVNPFENQHHHKGDLAKGEHVASASNQNLNQSSLTEQGNPTKGNSPGGNANEQRRTQANKPRSNPQGNRPMSVDTNSRKKGPGKKAD